MKMRRVTVAFIVGYGAMVGSASALAFSWASVLTMIKTLGSEASAWAVTTKQTALAANQQTTSQQITQKQLATALGAIAMSDRVTKNIEAFHSEFGQPSTIKCEAQKNGKLFVEAQAQQALDGARLMSAYASNRVGSSTLADAEALSLHRKNYCTVSEAKQGLCALTANGMQGWDADYSGPFGEKTLAPEGEIAGYAYASMVSDVRAESQIDCKSSACEAAQSHQLAKAALGSMVANSIIGQVTDRRIEVLTGH